MLALELLQPCKANVNSAFVTEVVFWSAVLIGNFCFLNYHHMYEYFCEEK